MMKEPWLDPFEHWKVNYYSYTLNELFEQCFLLTELSFLLIKPSKEFCFLPHGSYTTMNQFFQLSLRQNLSSFSCMKFDELLCVENKNSPKTENICGVLAQDVLNGLKLINFELTDLMAMERR